MSNYVQTCQIESTNVNVWFTSVAVTKNSPDPTRGRENFGAGGGAASPRTKKQSAGLFFAACEPPSCSSPTVTKNLAQPTRAERDFGAGGGARTRTVITPRDFKSLVSAIPPHRQTASIYYHVRCAPSSKIRAREGNRKDLLS